jgi:UDP-N-acetylglucosamine--N-acetylmuramyl-(pentapeptide) pyrophosphoryl-undecaprenol N-acetylglucosamine transferase
MSTVLWYVHDHGLGHLQRAGAVLAVFGAPVVVAAGPGVAATARRHLDVPVVELPSDVERDGDAPSPRGPWHHAPAGRVLRRRTAALATIAEAHDCTTAVVDVSVEVAALCSLLGLRTVAVRQSGTRSDPAHQLGLSCADIVWVPQHRDLEPIAEDVDDRWVFSGAFSRHDHLAPVPATTSPRLALLVVGAGGTTFDDAAWRDASGPAGWRVLIAGTPHRWSNGEVCSLGHVEAIAGLLGAASVVISAAGWSSVADAVAARTRLVLVPERRPFDEQVVRARRLDELGLAVSLPSWPHPRDLDAVLRRAERLVPARWDSFYDRRGASRVAGMIEELHRR